VSVNAWVLVTSDRSILTAPWTMAASAPVAVLVAAVWYVNDGWLRRRSGNLAGIEQSYSWMALGLVGIGVARGVPDFMVAPVWTAIGLTLASAGTEWRHTPLRWQGYALAVLAGLSLLLPLAAEATFDRREIVMATLVAGLSCALAATIRRALVDSTEVSDNERGVIVAIGGIGLGLLPLIEREVLPAGLVGAAWAATGLVLAAGPWRGTPESRWIGIAVLAGSALRTLEGILEPQSDPMHLAGALTVILLLYGTGVVSGRSTASGGRLRLQHSAPIGVATLLLSLLILDELRSGLVTPTWGLQGLALLVAGFSMRDRALRLSGLAVLLACLVKLFGYDLSALEPLPRIISFVVLGLVLLAVSWAYTRHRETVNRLLRE
jgi:hypothetical protein